MWVNQRNGCAWKCWLCVNKAQLRKWFQTNQGVLTKEKGKNHGNNPKEQIKYSQQFFVLGDQQKTASSMTHLNWEQDVKAGQYSGVSTKTYPLLCPVYMSFH